MPILIEGKGKGRAEAICTQGGDWQGGQDMPAKVIALPFKGCCKIKGRSCQEGGLCMGYT